MLIPTAWILVVVYLHAPEPVAHVWSKQTYLTYQGCKVAKEQLDADQSQKFFCLEVPK